MSEQSVTLLFTDMVGSTAVASGLDPDIADEFRRRHFVLLRQAVAETGGVEVKSLGDGLMVVFGSASRALSCAVAMQQCIERDNQSASQRVGLRVGLSGGEVSRENDDYFGEPVIEAARLCAVCDAGQILASNIVRLTAGRRTQHAFRSLGELELKGLAHRVDTVELLWEPFDANTTEGMVPLPGRLDLVPASGVIGRTVEIGMLTDALVRVRGGGGREFCVVSGEAGAGKSTLVAEAARVAFEDGACVLYGHCEEDLAAPYQLFSQTLNHFVKYAPDYRLAGVLEADGAALARLLPELARRFPQLGPSKALDADTERYQLHAAVVDLLASVSVDQPVVMVLEDLQWADSASLQLLRHVAAADQPMHLLILGTYRDSELVQTQRLRDMLATLHRENRVGWLQLGGLDSAGVVLLMEALAGHGLGDVAGPIAQAIYRETDGNPFFVTELLRHLAESEMVAQDADGRWTLVGPLELAALPETVLMVIGARVGRLGPRAERVLSLAAVIGRDFDVDVLATATATSEDELLDFLDAASSAALVQEMTDVPGRYNFSHALIQRTLYEGLGPTRRARAHRQIAEALERLGGPEARPAELAHHWLNAAQGPHGHKALEYSRQAADGALRALAPAEALRYYTQAQHLYSQAGIDDPLLSLDLAIGVGITQRQTGDHASRQSLLDAARRAAELGFTDRMIQAVLANHRGYHSESGRVDADKVALLEVALDRVAADHHDRPLLLATLCTELAVGVPFEVRKRLADEAIALARMSANPSVLVQVLNKVLHPMRVPGLLDWSWAQSAEALRLAEHLGDPVQLFWAAHCRIQIAACACDIEEMDRCCIIRDACADRIQQPMFDYVCCYMKSLRAQIAGDIDAAAEFATQARMIAVRIGEPDAMLVFYAQDLVVQYQRGTMTDWIAPLEEYTDPNPDFRAYVSSFLATAYIQEGCIDDSMRVLKAFVSTGSLTTDTVSLPEAVRFAEVATVCQHRESSQILFDLLAPFADQMPNTGSAVDGSVSHFLATLATTLGDHEVADAYFAHAAAFNHRAHAKFFDARTSLWWAKMLIARDATGDKDRARTLLTAAHTSACAHGYGDIERRSAEALTTLQ